MCGSAACPAWRGGGAQPRVPSLTPTGTPWLRPQPLAAPRFAFTEQVRFIDYEYTGYNYQAFDIGNHFNEFAGELGSSPRLPRPPCGWRRLPEGSPSLGCRGRCRIPWEMGRDPSPELYFCPRELKKGLSGVRAMHEEGLSLPWPPPNLLLPARTQL